MTAKSPSHLSSLTDPQRARLHDLAAADDTKLARSAWIVLLADGGLAAKEIGGQVGLSASGVRYWLRRFAADGMAIFDDTEPVVDLDSVPATPPVMSPEEPAPVAAPDVHWAQLEPGQTLPEAGRALLGHYLGLVMGHADRLQADDAAALSLLAQDAARLHGVFQVIGEYFDAAALAGFKQDARWVQRQAERALETRTVLDLLAAQWPEPDDEAAAKGLAKLLDGPREEAAKADRKLHKALDSRRYREFASGLLDFTRQEGTGVFPGLHNKLAIETQVALLVWQEFTRLRVEGRADDDPETQWWYLRRLQEIVQYLGNLLGPEVFDVLGVVEPLAAQLQVVIREQAALTVLLGYEKPPKDAKKKRRRYKAARPLLEDFIAVRRAALDEARAQLAARWAAFDTVAFRRKLALAIAVP